MGNFEGENDWELAEIKFLNTKHEEEAFPDVQLLVLEDRADVITMRAKKGECGALMVDREPSHDVFMFDSDPHKHKKTDCKSDTDMHFPNK